MPRLNQQPVDMVRVILGPAVHDESLTPREEGWAMIRSGIWNARGLISGLILLGWVIVWFIRQGPRERWVSWVLLPCVPIGLVAMSAIAGLGFRVSVGLFQMVTGFRYVWVERLFSALPWWGKVLAVPVLATITTAMVMGGLAVMWVSFAWFLGPGKR